ncbi:hypothetical protein TIFTF001_005380 [Ficus carica]|uniref:DUF4408 domain-containing protein n=1 Tax=Ficus carica TaxID=3494 RepID=A0AA88CZC4_FICCA|nr:hypothetical protein TIFTF001_005380 [Ficus carica]
MLSVVRAVSIRLTDPNNLNTLHRFLFEAVDDSDKIDDVKTEKDFAMRRFHRRRKFKWFLEACAVLLLLAQSSAYWLPIAGGYSGDLPRKILSVFRSHLFVFALFNAIILAVYSLSGKIPIPTDAGSDQQQPDLYDEFLTNSKSVRRIPAVNDSPAPETPPADEKTVSSENAYAKPKPEVLSECTDKDEKALVVKSYERTQSVRVQRKRSTIEQSHRDFRRSYTDVNRKLTSCGEEESKNSNGVNQLSNEEFKRAVDAFIANQKWMQREEYNEERKTERFMALTVCQ